MTKNGRLWEKVEVRNFGLDKVLKIPVDPSTISAKQQKVVHSEIEPTK